MYAVVDGFFDVRELNAYEINHIEHLIIQISREGVIDYESPAWRAWAKVMVPRLPLLDYSTVFVQRLAVAAVEYSQKYNR